MSRPHVLRLAAFCVVAAGVGVFTYFGLTWPPSTPANEAPPSGVGLALDFVPDETDHHRLDALRATLTEGNPRFPPREAREKSNAKLFTYLAGTSDERREIEAALEAIQLAYSPRSTKKEAPDADVDRVVAKHLRSAEPAIVLRAVAAARLPLMMDEPSLHVTAELVRMAEPDRHAAERYAAIEALNFIQPHRRSASVLRAFETALSAAEAHVISLALHALEQSRRSFEAMAEPATKTLGARVLKLTQHPDPGVRGRALALLAELEFVSDLPTKLKLARSQLKDEHGYVRAIAADVLRQVGDPSALHSLVHHTSDLELALYELEGWATLTGEPGKLIHSLPGRKRVAEAVLFAMVSLSAGQLQLPLGQRPTEDSLRQSARLTRSWYDGVQERLPREPDL